MVKEVELVEIFNDLNLGVTLTPHSIRLNQIKVRVISRAKLLEAK